MLGITPISALLQGHVEAPVLIERDTPANGNVAPCELEVIASLVGATAPQVIFEIGTFDGRTSLNMAANAPAGATVYTLDLPADGLGSTAFLLELGEDMFVRKERSGARFVDSATRYNIVQLFGDSGTFDFSPYYGKVDFMFIDGSHSYEYVKSDTLAALKMVRAGGTIIWHDYVREGFTPFPGVPRALKEFLLTDRRFGTLTQIADTSIVHLRVPEQQSCDDFQPRLRGDSSRPEHLAGDLLVSRHATVLAEPASIPVRIVARNTGGAIWLPSDDSVGPVRVGVRVLDMTGRIIDPDYYRIALPFRRAVFPGETVELAGAVPWAGREACILEFDLVADGIAWFNLPERPRIIVGEQPRPVEKHRNEAQMRRGISNISEMLSEIKAVGSADVDDLETTIIVGGRQLKLVGTHAAYMQSLENWQADQSAVAMAIKELPHGSLCLDVGAHIGLTAITMAALRPDFRVIAFEPLPQAQACLQQNLFTNGIENVELVEAAVGDFSGTISFEDNGPWSVATLGASVVCKAVRLDDLDLGSPAFIKIDVEGFEPNVLAGARQLIARSRPLMLMEYNSWTLLLHHYDPLTYADSIWSSFQVLQMFQAERSLEPPSDPIAFVLTNLTQQGCVTDLLIRPKLEVPELHTMTDTPQAARLRVENTAFQAELDAIHRSTSWRATALLRAIKRATSATM